MKSNMKAKKEPGGILKSIFAAHLVLLLHVMLIAGVGCMILFFGFVVQYMIWIFLGGSLLIFLGGYLLQRKVTQEGRHLRDMLSLPELSGKTIEISILGGMASMRLESSGQNAHPALPFGSSHIIESGSHQIRELSELVDLLSRDLISVEEFHYFKKQLMENSTPVITVQDK